MLSHNAKTHLMIIDPLNDPQTTFDFYAEYSDEDIENENAIMRFMANKIVTFQAPHEISNRERLIIENRVLRINNGTKEMP